MRRDVVAMVLLACGMGMGCNDDRSTRLRPDGAVADLAQPTDARANVPTSDAGNCDPCKVPGPGPACGLQIGITPFVTGGAFGGFQSDVGTGASRDITITISDPITWVSVKILDPDFMGNRIRTYDAADQLISEIDFPSDGQANAFTSEMGGTGGQGIVKVVLVAAPADYVAYDELMVVPAGCAPPIL